MYIVVSFILLTFQTVSSLGFEYLHVLCLNFLQSEKQKAKDDPEHSLSHKIKEGIAAAAAVAASGFALHYHQEKEDLKNKEKEAKKKEKEDKKKGSW